MDVVVGKKFGIDKLLTLIGANTILVTDDHAYPHPQSGHFCFSILTHDQGSPTRCNILRKVRIGRWDALCRYAEGQACRISVTPDKAEVSRTNGMGSWAVTDTHCTLV